MRASRLLPFLSLLLVMTGAGVAAGVGLAEAPAQPRPVTRVSEYYRSGPSASYDGDSGSIGVVDPLPFTVPGGTYEAVVTISFEYRTKGDGPFTMEPVVRRGESRIRTSPTQARLRASGPATSATVRFLVRLTGGSYSVEPFANGHDRISTSRVVLTVELTPAG